MINIDSFAVIGGDFRQARVAELLSRNHHVAAAGLDTGVELSHEVKKTQDVPSAVRQSECVILPLPLTLDGVTINAPFSTQTITIDEVLSAAVEGQTLFAGRVSEEIAAKADRMGVNLIDYLEREEFSIYNAIPTAEGAIQIAMEELPITLHGSDCLITGFGRISKVLAHMLAGLGAKVTVAARKYSDAAWIKTYGYRHIPLSELGRAAAQADVIFNTAPALLLDRDILKGVRRDSLVIDLASKPGGVNFEAAGRLGVKTIWALSLPGKVAPLTSGEIIATTIINILEENEL
ncbi:MAG: dipicolinate synthase subunit DpsA [Clostridiales bacterium]|nr:dipicolinate synthase subunit DpsA [Clostridiales bacterium]